MPASLQHEHSNINQKKNNRPVIVDKSRHFAHDVRSDSNIFLESAVDFKAFVLLLIKAAVLRDAIRSVLKEKNRNIREKVIG